MSANYEMHKETKKGWTKQPNAILTDKDLTSDAYKVISFLLSVTGDYNINIKGIAKTIHLSEPKVKRAIKLLQDTGYLQIVKIRNGKYFGGYKWLISDVPGVYRKFTDGISIDGISIPATSNYDISINGISIHEMSMAAPLYQYTEEYQRQNIKEEENQGQNKYQETKEREFTPTLTPLNQSDNSTIFSGNLNTLQAFNRFCDLYPKVGDREQAQTAFFAIPDIDKICNQIVNSIEWFEKSGRWNDWKTGQKNVSCPQAVKFLTRGDWQEYLKSGATMSYRERLNAILPDEEESI